MLTSNVLAMTLLRMTKNQELMSLWWCFFTGVDERSRRWCQSLMSSFIPRSQKHVFYPDVTDITLFPFDVVVSEFTMKTEKNVNEGKTMPCQIKEQMRWWSKTLESIRRPDAESCFEKDCFLVTQRWSLFCLMVSPDKCRQRRVEPILKQCIRIIVIALPGLHRVFAT